jgi:L-gulonate 3-dehydrogenase
MTSKITIVGTGLVGRAWAIVFARAGHPVSIFDPLDGASQKALGLIEANLPDLATANLLRGDTPAAVLARISRADTLEQALAGAVHCQESAPERVEVKAALYKELDRIAAPETVLASSTSGIPASKFSEGLEGQRRVLVAHPINPPHIIPLVEIVPAPWTDPAIVQQTRDLMAAVGQSPISTTREINGFIVNRLQGALLGEAFRLVQDGVCSVADIDAAVADGLGLRWSFIGPFETIDLNSAQGIPGYCDMLGQLYYDLAKEQADPREWTPELVAQINEQRRSALPLSEHQARQDWRDRRLAALVGHKKTETQKDEPS